MGSSHPKSRNALLPRYRSKWSSSRAGNISMTLSWGVRRRTESFWYQSGASFQVRRDMTREEIHPCARQQRRK